ncbi:MAG: hypothetical protein IKW03_00120 [Clostridia bacterium]|nr:hypothetical protein [Clostridia bacterium]
MKLESGIRKTIERDENGIVINETFFDEIRNVKLTTFLYEYNEVGQLKKESQDDGFGNCVEVSYLYDNKGNCSEICETEIDKGHRSYCHIKQFFYDSRGKKIKENDIYNETEFITDYVYDDNGNMIKSIMSDCYCEEVCEYEYDSSGNMTKKTEYTPEGEIDCVTNYSYNDAGQLEAKSECTRKGFFRIYEYFYDSKGFKIKEIIKYFSKANEEVYIVEHDFVNDRNGRVIYSKNKNDDFAEIAYFYNEAGSPVVQDYFNEKNGQHYLKRYVDFGYRNTISGWFEYVYDSDGKLVSENMQKIDGT